MINTWKMDFSFDPEPLRGDLDQIRGDEWIKHFNTGYFEGAWVGIALRSVGGVISSLYSDPASTEPYEDTPVLDRCPNVRALLKTFRCPLRSVRFLKLGAGANIREHRDYDLGFERIRQVTSFDTMLRILVRNERTDAARPAIFIEYDGVTNRRRADDYVLN